MEFELPRGAAREYLIIFGVAAVYVATKPSGEPSIVGASRDLERTAATLGGHAEINCAFWVPDKAVAERIVDAVRGDLPHDGAGWLAVRGERARTEIETVAAAQGVTLTNHDAAMARVHAAVQRVADHIAHANSTGELAWFNAAFRAWRLQAKKNFWPGMSYAEARAKLRKVLTKRLIKSQVMQLDATMLPEIFPDIAAHKRRQRRLDRLKK